MNDVLNQVLRSLKSGEGATCPAYLERQKSDHPRCTTGGAEWNNGWCRRTFGDLFDTGEKIACPCIRIRNKSTVIARLEEVIS